MYDPKAPSSVLALTEFQKPGVAPRVRRIAWSRCRTDHDADDLVSDSMIRVCDPEDQPWVPTKRPFLRHMHVVIRRVWQGQQDLLRTRSEVHDGGTAQDLAASGEPSVEDDVEERRRLETQRLLGQELKKRLGGDPEALALYELAEEQDLEPAEQARALGWTVEQTHLVEKRIRYRARQVRQEWLDREERRMKALRQPTSTTEGDAVTLPPKKDPARGWRYAEKLLDEEDDERLAKMSDEEVFAEIDKEFGPPRGDEPTAKDVIAKMEARAARTAKATPAAAPPPARVIPLWRRPAFVIPSALALAAAVFLVVQALTPPPPDGKPAPPETPAELGEHGRRRAQLDCDHHAFQKCLDDLDKARALDPAGDATPEVQRLRAIATEGLKAVPTVGSE